MISRVRELAAELTEVAEAFDPSVLHADQAEELVGLFTRIERVAASGRTRAAARAAEAKAWKRQGYASAEEWLAAETGSTTGQAARALQLSRRLERHEETKRQFARGNLSETQAGIVAGAAEENPAAEGSLLATAKTESVKTLTEAAARAKAAVGDEEARQARIHRERYASGGTDAEGAYRFTARMAGFQGGVFDTIWRRFREGVVREARKHQERLSSGQVGADALVLMAQTALEHLDGEAPSPSGLALPEVRLHLLVDHEAFERGHTEAGERCEIDGLGPVTVAQAQELVAQGAFVTASTIDGTEVFQVAHLGTCDPLSLSAEKVRESRETKGIDVQAIDLEGRHVPAVLDTALLIRDRVCAHPGCHRRLGLQRDHVLAVELGGRTSYRNLQRLCRHHHQQKTRDDMAKIRARRREARQPSARAGPAPSGAEREWGPWPIPRARKAIAWWTGPLGVSSVSRERRADA